MAQTINIIFVLPINEDGSSPYSEEALVFNKFISDIKPKEIPTKYVYSVSIVFKSGVEVTLKGNEITKPIPVNSSLSKKQWEEVLSTTETIRQIKIRLDFVKLFKDVNERIEKLFKGI